MSRLIAVCDGIAMGHIGMKYSLVTRDLIADSTEAMAMAHQFDALVMVPNCDKNVPGLLMAAARINVPTVFVSGGPMLAGRVHGQKRSLSSMFEAVGSYSAGTMTEEEVEEFEIKYVLPAVPVSGMYTANSMNCLTEVLGMGLKGNGNHSGSLFREDQTGKKHCGHAGHGNVPEEYPPKRHYDKRRYLKRAHRGYGSGLFNQQYASSAGYCP